VDFGIDVDPIEQFSISQRPIEITLQYRSKIYGLLRSIIEPYVQRIRPGDLERLDAMDLMVRLWSFLLQWLYRQWASTCLQSLPIFHQLWLMQFGPGFDKPPLSSGARTRHQLDRIHTVDRHLILIVSVKMRSLMRRASPPVHADDDTEETADLWHGGSLVSIQKNKP